MRSLNDWSLICLSLVAIIPQGGHGKSGQTLKKSENDSSTPRSQGTAGEPFLGSKR